MPLAEQDNVLRRAPGSEFSIPESPESNLPSADLGLLRQFKQRITLNVPGVPVARKMQQLLKGQICPLIYPLNPFCNELEPIEMCWGFGDTAEHQSLPLTTM
jgi:hypothetical protein